MDACSFCKGFKAYNCFQISDMSVRPDFGCMEIVQNPDDDESRFWQFSDFGHPLSLP